MPAPPSRTRKNRQQRSANRPNRQAEVAARVRAAQTRDRVQAVTPSPAVEAETEVAEAAAEPRARSGLRPAQRRAGKAGTLRTPGMQSRRLTREQEFAFIRADLRRLLVTAGSLAVVMFALLFVLEM